MKSNRNCSAGLRAKIAKGIVRAVIRFVEGPQMMPMLRKVFAANRFWILAAALFCLVPLAARGQTTPAKTGAWSGVLVTSACNADEAFNESPECFKSVPGAKVALYNDTNRLMYNLEPQEKVSGRLGDTVTVHGTLDEDTIQVASTEPMSIGLAVGQKAPDFSLRDEFGHVQTLETLKGANGTVLLFFRSADW